MGSVKNNYQLIKDAYISLDKKRFETAILILEKVLSSGLGDIYILFLLSVSYLYTNQFGKAGKFISKIKEINPEYMPVIQLDAFLKIKSALDFEEALRIYLDLVERYPADPHLFRGRRILSYVEDFSEFQKNARLYDFVNIPKPPKYLKKSVGAEVSTEDVFIGKLDRKGIKIRKNVNFRSRLFIKAASASVILVLIIYAGWYFSSSGFLKGFLSGDKKTHQDYSSVDIVSISGTDYDLVKNVNKKKLPYYYQSASKMSDDFNRARRLIKEGNYNDAIILLNRIYNSNANFVVKEKVNFLIKFVINLDDRYFEEIPYKKVNEKKYLYRGYSIRWKGRVADLKDRDGSQAFKLQVDYKVDNKERDNLSGEAIVYSKRIIKDITNGSMVEVKGIFTDILGKDKRIYIVSRGIAIIE